MVDLFARFVTMCKRLLHCSRANNGDKRSTRT